MYSHTLKPEIYTSNHVIYTSKPYWIDIAPFKANFLLLFIPKTQILNKYSYFKNNFIFRDKNYHRSGSDRWKGLDSLTLSSSGPVHD